MHYQGWNDYEIIYLIREGNEKALNLMYQKYQNYIIVKARSCGFKVYEYEDCIQEGYILLTKALKTFTEKYNKTFLKYFELILLHRFWRMKSQEKIYYTHVDEQIDCVQGRSLKEVVFEYKKMFSGLTAVIFEEVYYYNTSVKSLSEKLNLKTDKIYREIKKIKEKIGQEFDL